MSWRQAGDGPPLISRYKGNEWPEGMGKLCPTQRVLGTLLTYNCSNVAERQARLRAAQTGWTVMGRFWSAECSLRIRRIIFRSMVWSALFFWVGLSCPAERIAKPSTSSLPARGEASCGVRQVAAGLTQMGRNVIMPSQMRKF